MTRSASGRRVAFGAAWSYGSQIATILFQLVYAAIVSRLAGENEFGAYGVALSITALISLIANGGMSQAVARLSDVTQEIVGSLASFALLLGALVGSFTFLTADFWASVWAAPSASETIRWLSFSALIAPMFSLMTGLARRKGQFAPLAIATVISNVCGMLVGVLAVTVWGTASSLVVSAVSAQLFLLGWLLSVNRQFLRPRPLSAAFPHVVFSLKLVLAGILQYGVGNIGKLAATRSFGSSVMGQWNRAEVLTTIPMQQAQSAMVQAVYPEFRHDVASSARAKKVWVDMLLLVAWVSVPAGALLSVVAPLLIPVVLGSEWEMAAKFSVPLSLGVAIQPVSILLASALESLGSFRRIWSTDIVLLFAQVALVAGMLALNDVSVIVWGIALTNVARLLIHSIVAARIGYLDTARLVRGLAAVVCASGAVWVVVQANVLAVESILLDNASSVLPVLGSSSLLVVCLLLLTIFRATLPPVKLASRYGLL
ncbi:oligosaccharide flippase family protein [Paenarthrobacter sp. 22069]|uniref:oligosaccharide flippase family protein n=1 Tax=Paenarthrobacter sp. 22069 TaxID=3453864 RepID=UPI003F84210A